MKLVEIGRKLFQVDAATLPLTKKNDPISDFLDDYQVDYKVAAIDRHPVAVLLATTNGWMDGWMDGW